MIWLQLSIFHETMIRRLIAEAGCEATIFQQDEDTILICGDAKLADAIAGCDNNDYRNIQPASWL